MTLNRNYEYVLHNIMNIWGKDQVEAERENLVLKILIMTPFLAECRHPVRTAIVCANNFFLFADEGLKHIFCHDEEDDTDVFSRLEMLFHVPNGKDDVIKKAKLMLELIMLQDHMHDQADDVRGGKYNPVVSGAWKYSRLHSSIKTACIRIDSCPEFDNEFPLDEILAQNFWRKTNLENSRL